MANNERFQLTMSGGAGQSSVLALRGRVTVDSAADVHEAAMRLWNTDQPVVIDCSRAEYLDASIMQVIFCLGRDLNRRDVPCDLQGIEGPSAMSFRLCGVLD